MAAAQMMQGLNLSSLQTGVALRGAQPKKLAAAAPARSGAVAVRAAAEQPAEKSLLSKVGSGLAALGLAAALQFSPLAGVANADEFTIIRSQAPLESHYFDDAGVLSRVTRSDIKRLLTKLEDDTGYHIDLVTLRKSAGKGDVFELADKILENWYPTLEIGNKRGVVLLITTAKEGAVAGGPAFLDAIGDEILEAVCSENLPVLATDEKYNEAMYSTAKRLVARLTGEPDIPGPQFQETKRESNFRTKEQVAQSRDQIVFIVGGLLVIAFVVPMAQYFAYVGLPKIGGKK